MKVLETVFRLTFKPRMATVEQARKRIAEPKGDPAPPARLRTRHDVRSRLVEGFPCHTVAPRGRTAERAAIYLHGGAYISEIAPQHWALISKLADAGVRVEVPSYGLAPQHTHREAYPFVTAVYRELLEEIDAAAVSVVGDSAGGGLALGLAQTLGEGGLPQPRQLVLLSPWLDLTIGNPDVPAVRGPRPVAEPAERTAGRARADPRPRRHARDLPARRPRTTGTRDARWRAAGGHDLRGSSARLSAGSRTRGPGGFASDRGTGVHRPTRGRRMTRGAGGTTPGPRSVRRAGCAPRRP